MVRILALDIATHCGWATNCRGGLELGTWTLGTAKEITAWGKTRLNRRQDPRIGRLVNLVAPFCGLVDAIVFEDVEFSTYTLQTQLWSALRAGVWVSCSEHEPLFECVPVTTLKRFATGGGGADKVSMMRAAAREFPNHFSLRGLEIRHRDRDATLLDDNAIDAFWLLTWAEKNLARLKHETATNGAYSCPRERDASADY